MKRMLVKSPPVVYDVFMHSPGFDPGMDIDVANGGGVAVEFVTGVYYPCD